MKKSELRKIIREEMQRILCEVKKGDRVRLVSYGSPWEGTVYSVEGNEICVIGDDGEERYFDIDDVKVIHKH